MACSSSPKQPPPGVKVLGTEAQTDLAELTIDPLDATKATLRFSPAPSELADLAVDNKLVAGKIGTVAPYGLLYRVTSIDRTGGDLTVHGESAPLSDVIVDEHVTLTHTITAADIDMTATTVGGMPLAFAGGPLPLGVHLNWPRVDFDHVTFFCDDPVPCELSGHITFPQPNFQMDLSFDWHGLQRFFFDVQVDAEITANITGRLRTPNIPVGGIPILALRLTPIYIQAGPIPLMFTPRIDFKLGASINVAIDNADAGITAGVHLEAGIDHVRGQPDRQIGLAVPMGMVHSNGQVQANLVADVFARAEAGLYLYNQVGPYTYFQIGPQLDFATPRDPFFKLGLHVTSGLGGRVSILDGSLLNLIDYSHAFFDVVFPLFMSPNSAPSITYIDPSLDHPPIPNSPCFSCGFNQCCIGIEDHLPLDIGGYDLEDGQFTDAMVRWTSSNPLDVLPPGKMISPTFGRGGPGVRTLTATVTDSGGLQSHDSVLVKLPSAAPSVEITAPGVSGNYIGVPRGISAHAASSYFPTDDLCATPGDATFHWESDLPLDDTFIGNSATSCNGTMMFGSVGTRALTFTATDAFGQVSSTQVLVDVGPQPSCTVQITNPALGTAPHLSNSGAIQSIQLTATFASACPAATNMFFTVVSHLQGGVTREHRYGTGASVLFNPSTARTTDNSLPLMDSSQTVGDETIDVIFEYDYAGGGTATSAAVLYYQYIPA